MSWKIGFLKLNGCFFESGTYEPTIHDQVASKGLNFELAIGEQALVRRQIELPTSNIVTILKYLWQNDLRQNN